MTRTQTAITQGKCRWPWVVGVVARVLGKFPSDRGGENQEKFCKSVENFNIWSDKSSKITLSHLSEHSKQISNTYIWNIFSYTTDLIPKQILRALKKKYFPNRVMETSTLHISSFGLLSGRKCLVPHSRSPSTLPGRELIWIPEYWTAQQLRRGSFF